MRSTKIVNKNHPSVSSDAENNDLSQSAGASPSQLNKNAPDGTLSPVRDSQTPALTESDDEDEKFERIELEYFEIAGGPFFHGTSRRAARKIFKEGFKDWSWTAKNPNLRHLLRQGIVRWFHDGTYGRGTYVTRNWRVGLFFGPVLFRVSLQPGTRILRLDVPPDRKVLGSLRREFGKEILTHAPWKAMPTNKQLTLKEAVELARYHVNRWQNSNRLLGGKRCEMHEQRMRDLRKILVRYGLHGWGEPSDLGGIVIFATDRIQLREVVLSIPRKDWLWDFNHTQYVQGHYPSLGAFVQQCRRSTNRGNAVTRKWVEDANEQLVKDATVAHAFSKKERVPRVRKSSRGA